MKKRLMALTCTLCLCAGLILPAAASYSDVAANAWYADAAAFVTEKQYMTGTTDKTFSPNASVTRATVVTVLWRLEGSPAASVAVPFPDVKKGAWYETAAAWAKGKGIATGTNTGGFLPDALVTRQELAVFLYRYAQFKGSDIAEGALTLYTDSNKTSLWAVPGMKHAIGMGLLQGSDGKVSPGGIASRAQLAVILQRLSTPAMG